MKSKVIHQRMLISGLLAAVLASYSGSSVFAGRIAVSVSLRDLDTRAPVDARVRIEAARTVTALDRKDAGEYERQVDLGTGTIDAYKLIIEPAEAYVSRVVPLRGDRFADSLSRSFVFYLVKSRTFDQPYLNRGLPYFFLPGLLDGALAHYEAPFSAAGVDRGQDYNVKLYYNYSRALRETCLNPEFEYDTCKETIVIIGLLENICKSDLARCSRLNVRESELAESRLRVAQHEVFAKYRRISELNSAGRYVDAARLAEEAIGEFGPNSGAFLAVGFTRDDLLKSAGLSYLKAAEEREKTEGATADVCTLLGKARPFLVEISVKDAETTESLRTIEMKLARC